MSLLEAGVLMSDEGGPLRVDPTELRVTADRIDGHASGFVTARQAALSQAGDVALGSGLSGSALPQMLASWDSEGARFERRFSESAEEHRAAAASYARTDDDSAEGIGNASP